MEDMQSPKVNFLPQHVERSPRLSSDRGRSRSFFSPFLLIGIFVASFGFGRLTLSQSADDTWAGLDDLPILKQVGRLLTSPDRKLRGEDDDRINILLLGMGGEGHEGPLLTDTIMVASVKPSENRVALLSIPRDLIVPLQGIGWRKVNSANAFGELKNPGRGGDFTRVALEGLLGIDIPYYVRIDFNGFREIIDAVGGIDVHVDRAFTDRTYPTDDYRTQVVSFDQGWQHLSGEEALRFARSRHGTNGEGSDFARAKRQQKVLAALRDKLSDFKSFKNPAGISNTLAALQSNIITNFQIGEILRLARMGQHIDRSGITHKIIDNGPASPLTDALLNGAYVLVPRNDDWTGIRMLAADIFEHAEAGQEAAPEPAAPARSKVEIRNGTLVSGRAREIAGKLGGLGFEVVKIGNADTADYATTLVFDLTGGEKSDALQRLRDALGAAKLAKHLPKNMTVPAGVDFFVILGGDGL
jgi:LCP family protein required for cell wall assembly